MIKYFLGIFIMPFIVCLGCASKVFIEPNEIGVVVRKDEIINEVLKPGIHEVRFDSRIIIYNCKTAESIMKFDFVFLDATKGEIEIIVSFNPIPDSLSSFYRDFKVEYFNSVVEIGIRRTVRNLMVKYNPSDLKNEDLRMEVINSIKSGHLTMNYIELRDIRIVELYY